MAIFNTNEFLRKTFSKTIFGTAALRPEAVCADGFTLSIQASGMHYCIPNEDLSDGNYSKVELSYLSEEVEEFLPFAEDDEAPLATVYGYVPVETVDAVLAKHAHIHNPKEINEMGEYFLFLNHLTCSMASPLNNRCFYGANTTNEWVVREYIKDKENNPTIYNGLPLHTEYRVFVDFDTKEILGASPYWRSDVMKNEFKKVSSPQERHDYVVYKMHEDILNQRYHESVQTVLAELKKVIPRIELTGQWSVDVMRNGNDYYIIDMALAENSALNDCVPKNLLRAYPQQWLPGESNS